jgi:heterotetrameric sarcosine oxidase delta subunit
VSFVLRCPNCGPREVTDFGYGGEVVSRPKERPSLHDLGAYNHVRQNVAGVQREWWYHRSGCREWFQAERDTRTNAVLWTGPHRPGGDAPASSTGGGQGAVDG